MTQDDSAKPQREECEDANPSKALTSQIASSVLQERHRVRGMEAAPLKDQQNEYPQRKTLKRRGQKSESSIAAAKSTPTNSPPKSRSVPPRGRASDEDDDPFPYDKLDRNELARRTSTSLDLSSRKTGLELNVQEYPCPFRRRNPVLFNVRDHEHCAKRPFPDLNELKYVF